MELKNAVTVCLISLLSATLLMLIARALDLQAAHRLEPQLAKIVGELESIRKQGWIVASPSADSSQDAFEDGLIVYYLHSSTRCPTCREIESQAHDVVQTQFAGELQNGELQWKVVNYEEPSAAELAKKFEIQMPVVVLAQMTGGEISEWKSLDRVWALVGDKAAYAKFVSGEIQQMLGRPTADVPTPATEESDTTDVVSSEGESPTPVPEDLPIPE
jgi:hypothetical protein